MFILRGEAESESCLVEVECKAANLRSGAAFVFVDSEVRVGRWSQYVIIVLAFLYLVTYSQSMVTNFDTGHFRYFAALRFCHVV